MQSTSMNRIDNSFTFVDWSIVVPGSVSTISKTINIDDYNGEQQIGGGPVDFVLNKVLQASSKKFHLIDHRPDGTTRKYSFAGPGTHLDKRLNPDDSPKEWSKPIN